MCQAHQEKRHGNTRHYIGVIRIRKQKTRWRTKAERQDWTILRKEPTLFPSVVPYLITRTLATSHRPSGLFLQPKHGRARLSRKGQSIPPHFSRPKEFATRLTRTWTLWPSRSSILFLCILHSVREGGRLYKSGSSFRDLFGMELTIWGCAVLEGPPNEGRDSCNMWSLLVGKKAGRLRRVGLLHRY